MTRRLRVLVEAYECSPARGHAAGSAWQVLSNLSKWFDLWVITEARYENEINEYVDTHDCAELGLHFSYLPRLPRLEPKRYRPTLPVRATLRYRDWLRRSYSTAAALHEYYSFDVAHHLRASTFREPGYLWKLQVPFVWGPMGGTISFPWSMMSVLGLKGVLTHSVKNLVNGLQFRFSRTVAQATQCAARVLAQTCQDRDNLQRVHGIDAWVVHEQSTESTFGTPRHFAGDGLLKVAWAGRCIGLKGMPILIRSLRVDNLHRHIELHIAGSGPELSYWRSLAEHMGVASSCHWHGWLSREEMLALFRRCHTLAFPSLFEGTPAVVMQALSTGLPVICLDHCGFGDIIDETCGFKIPVTNPRSAVIGFSRALSRITQNPQMVEHLSKGAIERARQYSWDMTASLISKAYEDAVRSILTSGKSSGIGCM